MMKILSGKAGLPVYALAASLLISTSVSTSAYAEEKAAEEKSGFWGTVTSFFDGDEKSEAKEDAAESNEEKKDADKEESDEKSEKSEDKKTSKEEEKEADKSSEKDMKETDEEKSEKSEDESDAKESDEKKKDAKKEETEEESSLKTRTGQPSLAFFAPQYSPEEMKQILLVELVRPAAKQQG